MSLLVVGSVALDSVHTPHDSREDILGGFRRLLLLRSQLFHLGPTGGRRRRRLAGRAHAIAPVAGNRHGRPTRQARGTKRFAGVENTKRT